MAAKKPFPFAKFEKAGKKDEKPPFAAYKKGEGKEKKPVPFGKGKKC